MSWKTVPRECGQVGAGWRVDGKWASEGEVKGAGELSVAETYADVTGRECDGTLQSECF